MVFLWIAWMIATMLVVLATCCLKIGSQPHIRSLKGKHVVITGGSSGIGLALAKQCLSEGAFLTLVARTPSKLDAARQLLCSAYGVPPSSILLKAVDVSDAKAIVKAIQDSFDWRPIDILICNAGIAKEGRMGDAKIEDLEMVTRVNFMGCVFPINAAIPLMKTRSLKHPTSIVLMSSLSSLAFVYASNMYTPSKYALRGLAELLRFELLAWNIKVNLICPGFTETPMLDEVDQLADDLKFANKIGFYNREVAESPEDVARKTMEGIKNGEFFVSTTTMGFLLASLARGFIPPDSFTSFLKELVILVPIKLASYAWLLYVKHIIFTGERANGVGK